MITAEQAADIRQRNDALMAWVDSIRGKNGWASYRPEDKPAHVPDVSNEERSALEVFEFVQNPPDKYFLYINETTYAATTWTGDKFGDVRFGRAYKCPAFGGFSSTRVPVTIRAINGVTYHGTYYKSSGSFARIRQSKKKAARNRCAILSV
jgi:hypothetical protein